MAGDSLPEHQRLSLLPALRRSSLSAVVVALLLFCALVAACSDSNDATDDVAAPGATAATVETPGAPSTPPPGTTASPATPGAAASPTPHAPPANARPFSPELRAEVQPLLKASADAWGRPPKSDVAMYLIGRKEAIDYYRASFEPEDLEHIALQENVYKLLGLLPPSTDLQSAFLSLLGGGILGFYDPDVKSFFLLDDIGGTSSSISKVTIVHEFAHALQDQYFDLNAIEETREDDWDGGLALVDVIEGDAVQTETEYLGSSLRRQTCFTIPRVAGSSALPYVIQRELNSWYDDGNCFIQSVIPRVGEGNLGVFKNAPTTTEQILHPDKYIAGEKAKPVALTDLRPVLGEGWSELKRSNLGEFTLQNLLVLGLTDDRSRVQRAAEGWGGDGWALYGRGDDRLIEVSTAWDGASDALEFWAALRDSLGNRGKLQSISDNAFRLVLDGHTWRAALQSDRVLIAAGTNADAVEKAATALGLP